MQPIPDTGGGLSGFLTYVLWWLYQLYPFREAWFGPATFYGCVAALFRVSWWPFLWKAVSRDMRALAAGRRAAPVQNIASCLIELAGLVLFAFCIHHRTVGKLETTSDAIGT